MLSILTGSERISISNEGRLSILPPPVSQHHPIEDPLKSSMIVLLDKLQQRFPQNKSELKIIVRHVLQDSIDFNVLLSEMLYYEYASFQGGKFQWNRERIKSVVTMMRASTTRATAVGPNVRNSVHSTRAQVPSIVANDALATTRDKNEWETSRKKCWNISDETSCLFVDTLEGLREAIRSDPVFLAGQTGPRFVALDCEGVPASLELVQIGYSSKIYVFDGQKIGPQKLCEALRPLLTSLHITKVIHDLHKDAVALSQHGNLELANVLDSQLLMELHFGSFNAGFNKLLESLDVPLHPSKGFMQGKMGSTPNYWTKRPFAASDLEYAAMDAYCLTRAINKLGELAYADLSSLKNASLERAKNAVSNEGRRAICFDASRNYHMASAELLRLVSPSDGVFGSIHKVESEVNDAINILPKHFKERFPNGDSEEGTILDVSNIRDIVIDSSRKPQCWVNGRREFLCKSPDLLVTDEDIQQIVHHLGEIGHDNRAGMNGTLHRFSVMRGRDDSITGITIRIGRNITGMAELLMDIVLGSYKSILFLGVPGSGKTTVVREVTRLLAEEANVVVVDTSNEIGGDGSRPHKSIGLARRMMVKSLDLQSQVMIECVQNHTPSCMVIDEIGRPKEVEAARTVRQRGVRIIASAHGNLRELVGNKELNGLIGGLETVTMGDEMAKEEAKRKMKHAQATDTNTNESPGCVVNKNKTQRRSKPTFDVVVELGAQGQFLDWRVVHDVADAVDCILDGRKYRAERRFQDPSSGAMFLEYVKD
ncbi:hypothetical protein ACA910_017979 [Epithemia clementina (nom. ined.)]